MYVYLVFCLPSPVFKAHSCGVKGCSGTVLVVLDRAANRDNRRGCRGPREVARSRHDPGDELIGG